MTNDDLSRRFAELTTPHIADACTRLGIAMRVAPAGISSLHLGSKAAGRALPAQHFGSVDVFFEAFEAAGDGDVLVIDNHGRDDEACIGDLTALEARAAGVAAMVVWGLHRDGAELNEIPLPIFSYGTNPCGPQRVDPRTPDALVRARFGGCEVTREDAVFADRDGVFFVDVSRVDEVLDAAGEIAQVEARQAAAVRRGETLREKLRFAEYLERRAADPHLTFRRHLKRIGGAIEQ